MTTMPLGGLHHVTAIASDPQRNLDFYSGLLGLRLVKLTVNYDDPASYHFYYGDERGRPGSLLTFFSWPGAPAGRLGTGQTGATAFAVPEAALEFWTARLRAHGVALGAPTTRFGEPVVPFTDPDGLALELVATRDAEHAPAWGGGPVAAERAISGVHSVTLWEDGHERTARTLTGLLGWREVAAEGERRRYARDAGGPGVQVDVLGLPGPRRGSVAVGTVHHVAYRTPDDAAQQTWLRAIRAAGLHSSPVMDRNYFHSIYFREPGGVLFEIATDLPGFTTDEPVERLGTTLTLPPWMAAHRAVIERALPPVRLPGVPQRS